MASKQRSTASWKIFKNRKNNRLENINIYFLNFSRKLSIFVLRPLKKPDTLAKLKSVWMLLLPNFAKRAINMIWNRHSLSPNHIYCPLCKIQKRNVHTNFDFVSVPGFLNGFNTKIDSFLEKLGFMQEKLENI